MLTDVKMEIQKSPNGETLNFVYLMFTLRSLCYFGVLEDSRHAVVGKVGWDKRSRGLVLNYVYGNPSRKLFPLLVQKFVNLEPEITFLFFS
jgi:hypothetical protein